MVDGGIKYGMRTKDMLIKNNGGIDVCLIG